MTQSSLNQLAKQEKTRREILHKSDLIPPLPDLVAKLLGLLNKSETEPEHLEQLLQNDQVLVAKMLAMVNSPFYGLNRTIRTIKEAVMVLGFRGVRSLVLATSTAKFLQRDFTWYGHEPKGLWLHAVCVAAGSRFMAQQCKMSADESESLFVGGLLHDIGKLLLVTYLQDGPRVTSENSIVEYERATVGLDHTEAGALVTAKWNLAPEIQEVIKGHHEDAIVDEEAGNVMRLACVRLADCVAHELGLGYLPERAPVNLMRPEDLEAVGLSEVSWVAMRDEMAVTMEGAVLALGSLSS
ncbi:MAG: putative nucleotidyltransferase with HDIG domain [Planctomycetota bacterium]|jgi:putative nucleotidyltransferase with HDIG domain